MSDPKSFWRILFFVSLSNPVWFFLDKLFFKQEERRWVDDALSGLRIVSSWARNARLFALSAALIALCVALFHVRRAKRPTRAKDAPLTGVSGGVTSPNYGTLSNATPSPQNTLITPSPGSLVLTNKCPPPGWPPGNASATVMANQPLVNRSPMMPAFVNNWHWMQYDSYQRQLDSAARFAMQTTMPRYNHAMTP